MGNRRIILLKKKEKFRGENFNIIFCFMDLPFHVRELVEHFRGIKWDQIPWDF